MRTSPLTHSSQNKKPASNQPSMSRAGYIIRLLNALAVGCLAAFSLDKVLVIAGVISAGSIPLGWPLLLMVLCGAGIAVITYAMYKKDSWVSMLAYFSRINHALKKMRSDVKHVVAKVTAINRFTPSDKDKTVKSNENAGPLAVDLYGHIGGLIKFVMAFAGVWLLALGSPAFLYLIPVMLLVGGAQYFAESAELIPHSQALFTPKPFEKASPRHNVANKIFTGFKWSMVVAHAFGQGFGVFACMAIVGAMTPVGMPICASYRDYCHVVRWAFHRTFLWCALFSLGSDHKLSRTG